MGFHLEFTYTADEDIAAHKKAGNKVILKKILKILSELTEHPFTGIGKPEALEYNFSGRGREGLTKNIDLSI